MLFASLVCVGYFNPFTYQQVVLANLFPILKTLVQFLPLAMTVSIILIGITIVVQAPRQGRKLILGIFFLTAMLLPAITAILVNLGLPNSILSWALGIVSATLMVGPSAFDLWLALRSDFLISKESLDPRTKDFQLFACIGLIAFLVFGFAIDLNKELWTYSLVVVLQIAMIAYATLTLLFRIAERSKSYLRTEWLLCGFIFVVSLYWMLSSSVFPALAFVGAKQNIFSALISVGVAALIMGLTPSLAVSSKLNSTTNSKTTGLRIFVAPLTAGTHSFWLSLLIIPSVIFLERYLVPQIALMDWNFMGQKGIVIFAILLLFASVQWLMPFKTPNWFHVTHPFVIGLIVLAIFIRVKVGIAETNANGNIVFSLAKTVLTTSESTLNQDFYRFLQENSNIPKSVVIAPPAVNLTREQKLTGRLSPTFQKRFNIIMIVVDSLRPDYLQPYNPNILTTPAIAEFANDSVVFQKAFTRYGATGLSEPSIWVGGTMFHQQYISPFYPLNSLQKMLEVDGYLSFVSMDSILKQILRPNESLKNLDEGVSTQDIDLCNTLPRLYQEILTNKNTAPLFAYTQPQNIHVSVIQRENKNQPPANFGGFNIAYASSLSRLDKCFGRFIDQLKQAELYEETIVVFTSDHGDSLGEDGRYGHAYTIFPEIVRIPLIIHLPRVLRNQWAWSPDNLAFSTDITPSLYTLMGHPTNNDSWMWGQSLFWPTDSPSPRKNHEPYLLASSYGAVFGLLEKNGDELYIVDAVNLTEHYYDLRASTPIIRSISADDRAYKFKLLRTRISEINSFYNYRGSNDDN
jgi:hypothetical protein